MAGLGLQYMPTFFSQKFPGHHRAFSIHNAIAVSACAMASHIIGGHMTQHYAPGPSVPFWSSLLGGLSSLLVFTSSNFSLAVLGVYGKCVMTMPLFDSSPSR